MPEFQEAIERIIGGLERKNRLINKIASRLGERAADIAKGMIKEYGMSE